jgi:hypothetical protein
MMDWEKERDDNIVRDKHSTSMRTAGTLVLIVSDFWFFYYWISRAKVDKD